MDFIESTKIKGLFLIKPQVYGDNRGSFFELYSEKIFNENGIEAKFVQDNQSFSAETGTLRGMHMQLGSSSQAKLVRVIQGKIFDVAVDVRPESPTFGQWEGFELSGENNHQLFIPRNFLHGFMTLTPNVIFSYKCDNLYDKPSERGVIWNDPTINITWPLDVIPVLSDKDKLLPTLDSWK
ncbi:MAG: dTDP-4-dehydrorhamnose 3,5-epimerase [Candidatus Shapirobacteria bacterium]